ncbi:hypothetical protein [Streptomyces achromogenes]|uniref:hypothetical protein n=1 Tax=Streptomyces achromogenes TaxID=67255 RepID=UPI0036B5EE66
MVLQRGTLAAGRVAGRRMAARWTSSGLGAGGRMGVSWAVERLDEAEVVVQAVGQEVKHPDGGGLEPGAEVRVREPEPVGCRRLRRTGRGGRVVCLLRLLFGRLGEPEGGVLLDRLAQLGRRGALPRRRVTLAPVADDGVAVVSGFSAKGVVAAAEGVVSGEREDQAVQHALLGVEDLQAQTVVFASADGAGEVDTQPEWRAGCGGGVVGVADDGAVGELELLGEELLRVQGHGALSRVRRGSAP